MRTQTSPRKGMRLADYGHFWVGVQRKETEHGTIAGGQMHVQFFVPETLSQPFPLVMVHGGGGQGLDYLTTPDGRPGWATWFVNQGYAVYVVDRPGHGRALWHAAGSIPRSPPMTMQLALDLFVAPALNPQSWPQARAHTQWPATGEDFEAALDQFLSGQGCMPLDLAAAQNDMRRCGAALLDRLGPAILMTHSMSGPFGWLVADARPHLVKAIVAVEPIGPAFAPPLPGMPPLQWGLTSVPITYAPPVSDPAELATVERSPQAPEYAATRVQVEPARTLPNLAIMPVAVVTAEASFMTGFEHGVVDFLTQAGVHAQHIRLEDHGLHGNGHLMMLERNSDEIAAVIASWLTRHL
jgi:pimeloyl-ACP methyl ester carboxylesterase